MARPGIATLLAIVALGGCAPIRGVVRAPEPPVPHGTFRAGAAKVDITPLPGIPMGGHSIAGTTARGYWTRLYARAIYLEDERGRSLVLASCDLWSIPGGLADRVAQIVRDHPTGARIGRAQIVLAATHTHQSPANYSTSRLYNDYASRWSGFDARLFEFLAQRIATAVLEAAAKPRPAKLWVSSERVLGLARNRSLPALLLDPERDEVLAEGRDVTGVVPTPEYPDARASQAVDPTLTVLRVTTSEATPRDLALAAFVAVHPTAMGHETEVYSSDLTGAAATLVESHLSAHGEAPVVAVFNGAEGDVSPIWYRQDRSETIGLGLRLADAIVAARGTAKKLEGSLAIERRFTRFTLAGARFHEPGGAERRAAMQPLAGAATFGGAEDGRTIFYDLGWVEGVHGPRRFPDQGPKQPPLDPTFLSAPLAFSISRLAMDPSFVPSKVSLGVYRIGPITLATLPGEFTTVMGRRIASWVRGALPPPTTRVLLIGLANEYVSYFATPEEYEAQHYEGASTLYGPEAGPAVGVALAQLAGAPEQDERSDRDVAFSYRPGPSHHFGVDDVGRPAPRPDDGLAGIVQDLETHLPDRTMPTLCWRDQVPAWPRTPAPVVGEPLERREAEDRNPLTPHVTIEVSDPQGACSPLTIDGSPETDRGTDFVTVFRERDGTTAHWCVIWMPPRSVASDARVRFKVERIDGGSTCSPSFSAGAKPEVFEDSDAVDCRTDAQPRSRSTK